MVSFLLQYIHNKWSILMKQDHAQPVAPVSSRKNTRRTVALWLLIGPTALIIGTLILYAVIGYLLTVGAPLQPNGLSYHDPSIFSVGANIFLFIAAIVGITTWLPGLIIGTILLVTKKENNAHN